LAFYPKALNTQIALLKRATHGRSSGFLNFNAFPPLTPPGAGTVAKDVEILNEITASGNAPDLHRIPYYFEPINTRLKNHGDKSNSPKRIFQDKNCYYPWVLFYPLSR
jgi:hypothetical protein